MIDEALNNFIVGILNKVDLNVVRLKAEKFELFEDVDNEISEFNRGAYLGYLNACNDVLGVLAVLHKSLEKENE